jgi:hypothetical protein
MEQLELKQIVGYLPYGLWVEWVRPDDNIIIQVPLTMSDYTFYMHKYKSKPILFPISLFKDINSDEMNELNVDLFNQMELCDLANKKIHFQNCNHSTILICLENKIDFQNLIERGLAIEVTEEFNPYK